MSEKPRGRHAKPMFMTPQEVAQELGIGTSRVRQLDRELRVRRTETGRRYYLRKSVDEYKTQRDLFRGNHAQRCRVCNGTGRI